MSSSTNSPPKGEAEFISEFAHELPARVFLALMDWPIEDAPMFTEATDAVLFGKPGGTQEESDQATDRGRRMTVAGYFQKVIADRRANPRDDATSTLIHTEVEAPDGTRLLNDEELFRMFFLLLMGGLHTVQGSLAWSIVHLVNNTDQRAALIADPTQIPKAVEEILRIEAAVVPGRRATRDVELGGVRIAKDDQLILMLCSANRDPARVRRSQRSSTSRATRTGTCRSALDRTVAWVRISARVELVIALEELHRRIPDYQLVESDPPVFHSTQVRGCHRMPITFTPESPARVTTSLPRQDRIRRALELLRNETTDKFDDVVGFEAHEFTDPVLAQRSAIIVFGRVPSIVAHGSEIARPYGLRHGADAAQQHHRRPSEGR